MTSKQLCDPCNSEGNTAKAVKFCTDCEEKLCRECGDFHCRYKAFKLHNLIELSLMTSTVFSYPKHCDKHEDMLLEFYCTQHDITCCKVCMPELHRSCKKVISLDIASENIKSSAAVEDALSERDNITETLKRLFEGRLANYSQFEKKKKNILHELDMFKRQLFEKIDELEHQLRTDLTKVEETIHHDTEVEKHRITKLLSEIQKQRRNIDLIRNYGTNNQLFLSLKHHDKVVNAAEKEIGEMIGKCTDSEVAFEQAVVDIKSLGYISQIRIPLNVEYKPLKFNQAQAHAQSNDNMPLTKLKLVGNIKLKKDDIYDLSDIAITNENRLFLCNFNFVYPLVYVYRNCLNFETEMKLSSRPNCIALIPGSNIAVVTLPDESSIQFLNTASVTTGKTVKLNQKAFAVSASADKIITGGKDGIEMLDKNGKFLRFIPLQNFEVQYMVFKDNSDILSRRNGEVQCIDITGKVVHVKYRYKVSGNRGIAAGRQGQVYLADYWLNKIHKLSEDGALTDCILPENDSMKNPSAMTFNRDFDKLFVISCVRYSSDTVKIYSCS